MAAALAVGLAWTLWHVPFYFEGTVQNEAGLWSQDFWFDMANRVPLAVLFAWVYIGTGRSILSAVMLHAADNVASVLISPEGDQLMVRLLVVIALALVVARVGFRRQSAQAT